MVLQAYVALLSEYIHSVLHDDTESEIVRDLVNRVWTTLKRSTKAGPRKTVSFLHSHMLDYVQCICCTVCSIGEHVIIYVWWL